MKPMSAVQWNALEVLAAHGRGSSYELRRSRGTLNALVARGYATKQQGIGAIAMPRTSIIYTVTNAGLAVLAGNPSR